MHGIKWGEIGAKSELVNWLSGIPANLGTQPIYQNFSFKEGQNASVKKPIKSMDSTGKKGEYSKGKPGKSNTKDLIKSTI